MKIIAKFIIIGAFLFVLIYSNRDRIPVPTELKTFDFITSGGIDIKFDDNRNSGNFSVSYISSEEIGGDNTGKSNDNKNLLNVKSNTLNSAIEQLQGLTNKSVKDSHLEYILIGDETARENLGYFIKHYSRSPSIRLDVDTFITKDMTSEKFIEKALTSEMNINARIDAILKDKTQVSSLTKRNLKDLLQIFYSNGKTGLLPVLEIVESPIKNDNKDKDDSENNENEDDKKYTFGFYGLGIIKDGKLVDYIEKDLVRSYIILTKNLQSGDIKITDEKGYLSTFTVKSSNNKISFECDNDGKPVKAVFDINIDVNFDETFAREKILTDENIPVLNNLQNEVIKSEIEKIIAKSKETGADFLRLGETFAIQHPYKPHRIKDDWNNVFQDLEYDIRVSTVIKRYYNINAYDAQISAK
jgi:spore germination protein KC